MNASLQQAETASTITPLSTMPTSGELERYASDGYFVRKALLDDDEVANFRDHAREQLERESAAGDLMSKGDREGNQTLLKMWNRARGTTNTGFSPVTSAMVGLADGAAGKPVYLYSHKMTMKQPRSGGAWEWHQDFGYWYNYGCLAPDMLSIWGRARSVQPGQRLLAGAAREPSPGAPRSRARGRSDQREPGARGRRARAARADLRRDGRRGRAGLPREPPAPLGRQPKRHPSLGLHLLVQRGRQRSVQA